MADHENNISKIIAATAGFVLVFMAHFVWVGLFPETDPAQAGWATMPLSKSWLQSYIETQSYWLGYSFGLSTAFAVAAVYQFLNSRCLADRRFAVGGITFSGTIAVAGCFLIGCCGSPMLVVWANLFGAAFLPFAKPALAGLTTVTIALAWWWMIRQSKKPLLQPSEKILPQQ